MATGAWGNGRIVAWWSESPSREPSVRLNPPPLLCSFQCNWGGPCPNRHPYPTRTRSGAPAHKHRQDGRVWAEGLGVQPKLGDVAAQVAVFVGESSHRLAPSRSLHHLDDGLALGRCRVVKHVRIVSTCRPFLALKQLQYASIWRTFIANQQEEMV